MFGSKLRSWMENHIVRPRKKGNKTKNGTSGNLVSSTTQNGHKGTSFQGDSSAIASPARRSEVSPIQSHTTSRAGWQSPQDNPVSPKSDNYPYRHTVKSMSSPKHMIRNSSYTLETNSSNHYHPINYSPHFNHQHQQQQSQQHYQQYSKSVDCKHRHTFKSCEHKRNKDSTDLRHLMTIPNKGGSGGSGGTGGGGSSTNCCSSIKPISSSTTPASSSTSNEMLEQQHNNYQPSHNQQQKINQKFDRCTMNYHGLAINGGTSGGGGKINMNENENQSTMIVKNGDCIESTPISNKYMYENISKHHHQQKTDITNHCIDKSSKPQQQQQYNNVRQQQLQNIDDCRYGKILHRVNSGGRGGDGGGVGNVNNSKDILPTLQYNNYDQYNANIIQYQQPIRCDNNVSSSSTKAVTAISHNNCTNNNNGQIHTNLYNTNGNGNNHHSSYNGHSTITNANVNNVVGTTTSVGGGGGGVSSAAATTNGTSGLLAIGRRSMNETNRNMLRTSRYSAAAAAAVAAATNNSTHLVAPGNHQLAHMINSLSSPESAYSTGYSTDGTSPGASYTPEYYINMRTGTHYFPSRGVSSAAVTIEQSRHKFGLNKIDEATPPPEDSLPIMMVHRRTESCDIGRRNSMQNGNTTVMVNNNGGQQNNCLQAANIVAATGLSPDLQRRLALQNYKGLESPSPRQRCRIKTNPWFSNVDPAVVSHINYNANKRIDMETSSTSSGIKSSSDAGGTDAKNGKKILSSESESSSSSTEIEVSKKTCSPNTIRKRKVDNRQTLSANEKVCDDLLNNATNSNGGGGESDDDATLNEMMGKFDESYCYEKETDILSDSDPTECISDLDTGQDGGDECDTDELLDIDFIDNGSTPSIVDKKPYENTGTCSYHNNVQSDKSLSSARSRKSRKITDEASARRKKRLTRTRKRTSECRDPSNGNMGSEQLCRSTSRERGSKSLGGTPLSLRRNQSNESKSDMVPLANRSNSLTFTEIHSIRSRYLAIAESEKALLKADLEADVKYKQLIHEAETILVSMKTTALKDTPVNSPSRRICNMPANKRVEMLRCEADLRRELLKAQISNNECSELSPLSNRKHISNEESTVAENVVVNKRIETLRNETASAPNSPKSCRFSPRKTHITNFIYQNASPTDLIRRKSSPEPPAKIDSPSDTARGQQSTKPQQNGRKLGSPPKSPTPRRRYRSQSPKISIESDTDSDNDNSQPSARSINRLQKRVSNEVNGNFPRRGSRKTKTTSPKNRAKSPIYQNIVVEDIINRNLPNAVAKSLDDANYCDQQTAKAQLMSFRSIDMGNKNSEIFYCPQSEPLKRKIYSGSSTLEKLKKSLEMDSEIPKKALLQKISTLRQERYAAAAAARAHIENCENINGGYVRHNSIDNGSVNANEENLPVCYNKRQLILNTIEDLKRSLEDQSVELCGLNDDDD